MSNCSAHSDLSLLICCGTHNTILDVTWFGRDWWPDANYNGCWLINFQFSKIGKSRHDAVWIICAHQICPSCSCKGKFYVLLPFATQTYPIDSLSKQGSSSFHITAAIHNLACNKGMILEIAHGNMTCGCSFTWWLSRPEHAPTCPYISKPAAKYLNNSLHTPDLVLPHFLVGPWVLKQYIGFGSISDHG